MESKFYQRCFYKKPCMKTEELMREMGQPLQTGEERRRDKESKVLPDGWCQGWRSPEPGAAATTHKHAPHLIRQLFDLHGLPSRKTPSAHTHTHTPNTQKYTHHGVPSTHQSCQPPDRINISVKTSPSPHLRSGSNTKWAGGAGSMSVVMSLLTEGQLVCRKRRTTN